MALIMGLEGFGNRRKHMAAGSARPSFAGLQSLKHKGGTAVRSTTMAGLYGTFDVMKAHPLLILAGLAFGGYWATRRAEGKGLVPDTWGEQRLQQARTRSLHGTRRRRK